MVLKEELEAMLADSESDSESLEVPRILSQDEVDKLIRHAFKKRSDYRRGLRTFFTCALSMWFLCRLVDIYC